MPVACPRTAKHRGSARASCAALTGAVPQPRLRGARGPGAGARPQQAASVPRRPVGNQGRRGGRLARPEPTVATRRSPRPARASCAVSSPPGVPTSGTPSPRGIGKGPAAPHRPTPCRHPARPRHRDDGARTTGVRRIPQAGERGGRRGPGRSLRAGADSQAKLANYRHSGPPRGSSLPCGGGTRKPVESETSLPGAHTAALNSAGLIQLHRGAGAGCGQRLLRPRRGD